MAPRTIYANLADGLQNFGLWDQSLADMGNLGIIPCTAVGTNAITLAPMASAFAPNISNPPQQLQNFSFVAAATSTGSVTINGLKLYKEDGATQAAAGDLIINVLFGVAYNSALNSGAGGYQIAFPITSIVSPVITGATISGSTITTSTYNGNNWTAGTGTLTIAALKTLTANATLTLAGTDGTTMTFPTTSATLARTDAANTFTGTQTIGALVATTINGNTLTAGTYILTGAAAKTLTFSNSLTLAGTDATTITFQGTDTYVGKATTDILTNKTYDTAGTGNVFKINGVAISANTGTGSNVLATSPALVTPALGSATGTSLALTGGDLSFGTSGRGWVGTTTNDNANAGNVGEYVESVIASGSAVSLSNGVSANVTSITFPAGDWDLDATVYYTTNTTTSVTALLASLSTTTATLDQTAGRWAKNVFAAFVPGAASTAYSQNIPPYRFSVSGSTTVFLVVNAGFTVSTLTGWGLLRARRVR